MEILDSDRDNATVRLHTQLRRYVELRAPWFIRGLSDRDEDDFLQDFWIHLQKNDCANLRTYADQGSAFVNWLTVVGSNYAIRWAKNRPEELGHDLDIYPGKPTKSLDPILLRKFKECLEAIGEKQPRYRTLLEYSADGYKPRHMIGPCGYARGDNKKISYDLEQARKRIGRCLKKKGIREAQVRGLIHD